MHCRNTYGKVTQELDGLRLLTSSTTIDPKDLQKFYTELVSLNSRMGMELEALSRYGLLLGFKHPSLKPSIVILTITKTEVH